MLKDFSPVILAATAPNILIVNPSVPAKSVAELIAYTKANPGKGGPEATAALLGGQIDYLIAITSTALPHIKAGRVRALGITSSKRSPLLPDVPTIVESGLPGFEAVTWFGFEVPKGTPPAIMRAEFDKWDGLVKETGMSLKE